MAKKWASEHGNKIVKMNKGGYIEVKPRGFGRMLKSKRPTTKIFI